MRLRDILIMIVIFSMMITAYAGLIGEFGAQYQTNSSTEFGATFNKTLAVKAESEEMQKALNTTEVSSLGSAFLWATGAWNILMMVFNSVDLLADIIGDFAEIFSIPKWVATATITIILIIVIFEIIGAIFKRNL